MFEAHLAAGGVDDPDAAIGRGHMPFVVLEIIWIAAAALGLVIAICRRSYGSVRR